MIHSVTSGLTNACIINYLDHIQNKLKSLGVSKSKYDNNFSKHKHRFKYDHKYAY